MIVTHKTKAFKFSISLTKLYYKYNHTVWGTFSDVDAAMKNILKGFCPKKIYGEVFCLLIGVDDRTFTCSLLFESGIIDLNIF